MKSQSNPVLLIPAYQPSAKLVTLVKEIVECDFFSKVLIIDDGSDASCYSVLNECAKMPDVRIEKHAVNLGKGQALRTGFNHILLNFPESVGVVTADADGQHLPQDIRKLGKVLLEEPLVFHFGVRKWEGPVPLRSKIGNLLTRAVFRLFVGQKLTDTQTGLRGIPRALCQNFLTLKSERYAFETDAIIQAFRAHWKFREHAITTVYIDGNAESHFNPLLDSLRIYYVFLRFAFSSIAAFVVDLSVFQISYLVYGDLLISMICGRVVSGFVNFSMVKYLAFRSQGKKRWELQRYILLVACLMLVSYSLIRLLTTQLGTPVTLTKVMVEVFLFFTSFVMQNIFVFRVGSAENSLTPILPTDWNAYYKKTGSFTPITRRITTAKLINLFHTYCAPAKNSSITELGGANSCFFGAINQEFPEWRYRIIDSNRFGLNKFRQTYPQNSESVDLVEADARNLNQNLPKSACCFSVGLIEHFDPAGTLQVIAAHFKIVENGGKVIMTFPTPTWLYRIIRSSAENLKIWQFPDERPLEMSEVVEGVKKFAKIEFTGINWWIGLTQGMIVATKLEEARNN